MFLVNNYVLRCLQGAEVELELLSITESVEL